jgi:hypothetical protein
MEMITSNALFRKKCRKKHFLEKSAAKILLKFT